MSSPIPYRRRVLVLALSTALSPVLAQTGSPAETPADEAVRLDRVVVTAQKREQKLQDVPNAVTAISARELESRNINNVSDLGALAPNVQVSLTPGNSTAAQIAIRGSVTTNPALFWEPTVGMYVDGVYMGKTQGSVFDIVDLDRIEILRGPQGTLYGRNTLAGAINMVTRKPTGEWGGSVYAELGNYNARVGKATLDLPQMGIVKAAVGVRGETRDGWVKTTAGSSVDELNSRRNYGGRVALNFDISKDFQVDYRYDTSHANQKPTHSQVIRSTVDQDFGFTSGIIVAPGRATTASVDGPLFEKLDIDGHSITAEWKPFAGQSLKYIWARRTMDWKDALDLDGSPVAFAHTQRLSDYKQQSHELQWVGAWGDFNYVLGAYRFTDDGFTNNPQTFFYGAAQYDSRYGFSTTADAIYGQIDWRITERATLTAGLRHTREDKTGTRQLAANGFPLIAAGTEGKASFTDNSPTLALGYKISEGLNVYGRWSQGFKSGGFNGEAQTVVEALRPYQPEKLDSFELGAKTVFANGRGLFNVAVFENRTKELQQAVFTAQGSAASNIRNVGKATTRGLEIEAQFRPIDALRLQVGYGYLKAKYDEYMELGVDVAGNRAVIHAPKHTFNLVADATLARTQWGVVRALADYVYTGDYYLYPYQLRAVDPGAQVAENTHVTAAGFLNLRLALGEISLGSGSAEASLWVRNALDRAHVANLIDFGPGFGNLTQAYYSTPRTIGVGFNYNW